MGLVVFAGCGDCGVDDIEDVQTSVASLVKGFFEDFVAETVALDVHLGSCDTVDGTCHLEVHIAEVVFVAEDVAEDGVFGAFGVGDKTHGDTADGLFHLNTCVEQSECTGANGSHGGRTVTFEDIAHDTANVGEIIGEHTLEGAVCEVSVAYFATSYTTLCLGLACREGREVVVKKEAFATLVEHVVKNLLVEFGTEGNGGEALCLTTGEDCRSVRSGNIVDLAPDGADFGGLAAIETHTFIEDAAAHGFFFNVVVVALYKGCFFVAYVFGKSVDVFLADCVEAVLTPVLVGATGLCDSVSLVVALSLYVGTEFFVVHFVAVFALYSSTGSLSEFELNLALFLDGFVGKLEGGQKFGFAHFVHFAFHHHDIVVCCTYHQFHIGALELLECGVDDELTVNSCHTNLGDGSVEGYIAHGESCGCSKACESIGHILAVRRVHGDVYKCVCVVVIRE